VLGAAISSPEAMALVAQKLATGDFFHPVYSLIYRASLWLFNQGTKVDVVTVASTLERYGKLDEAGGEEFLRLLTRKVPDAENIEAYIESVRGASTARKVLHMSQDVLERISAGGFNQEELVNTVESSLVKIREESQDSGLHAIKEVMYERYKNLGEEEIDSGVATGFANIDHWVGGLVPSRLHVLAARPGVGKTTLALNIAQNVSLQKHGGVLFFSLEMSRDELCDRIVCSLAEVVSSNLRMGNLLASDYARVYDAIGTMERAELFIDDSAGLTLQELHAKVRHFAVQRPISLVVVDYLQLMTFDGSRTENRQQEVANITRGLKSLAKEMSVPVIAVSQLNRDVEARKDKKPLLSDLRESGAVEQDADVVLFIWFDPEDLSNTVGQVIIAKHRNGPTGIAELTFAPEYNRFRDRPKFAREGGRQWQPTPPEEEGPSRNHLWPSEQE
jgi:replicative DNA helicase